MYFEKKVVRSSDDILRVHITKIFMNMLIECVFGSVPHSYFLSDCM